MTDPRPIVDLATWQEAPDNRFTFSAMREVVPTARVAAAEDPLPLPEGPSIDLDTTVTLRSGTSSIEDALERGYTDGLIVLHDGAVVAEKYFGALTPSRTHMLFSCSKSHVGCVAGNLIETGALDPSRPITDYLPEMSASGYAGATVRNILDMRSGIRFSEDYWAPGAEVRHLDQSVGWVPRVDEWVPATLYGFLPTLVAQREHGGVFEYRSCETDVLGWVCERAAGESMPSLLSRLLWSRFAETDMDAGVDRGGAVFHDGGLAVTLRDAARFGEVLRNFGRRGSDQVVPAAWIEDSLTGEGDSRQAFADSPTDTGFPGGMYRNQFWVPHADRRVLLCLGIHGQMIHVDFDRGTVVARLSSLPTPLDAVLDEEAFAIAEALSELAG